MEEENEQVDSAISRLHDLECWYHQIKQGSHKERGFGWGKDKSSYNVLFELTFRRRAAWPPVRKQTQSSAGQCWSWWFWNLLQGSGSCSWGDEESEKWGKWEQRTPNWILGEAPGPGIVKDKLIGGENEKTHSKLKAKAQIPSNIFRKINLKKQEFGSQTRDPQFALLLLGAFLNCWG